MLESGPSLYIYTFLFATIKKRKMHQRSNGRTRVEKKWGFTYPSKNGEMFGPAKAFTKKYLKNLDLKRRSWQVCGVILTICILLFIFTVSPKHLDIRLPRNEDLLETPMLRGQEDGSFNFLENPFLKRRIVDFLLESCDQMKSYDMLFCHNVLVNGQPLQEPCFAICGEQTFYANVQLSTTEDTGSILCSETYADLTEKKHRASTIVLTGQRFQSISDEEGESGAMVDFTRIPKKPIDVCRFHHAVDIVGGTWIASE